MQEAACFAEQLTLFGECECLRGGGQPRFFIWENVPGAFSSNKGADFRAVLEEIGQTEIPMPKNGKWANAGMAELPQCEIAWRVLDAQYWGVPQRRRRIFLVADFGTATRCAGEILFEPESVRRNTAACERTRKGVAARAERGTRTAVIGGVVAAGFIGTAAPSAGSIGYEQELSPTLMAEKLQHVAICDMTHANEVMRSVKEGVIPTLNARMGTGGNQGGGSENLVMCVGNGQINQSHLQEKAGALNCMHDQQIVLTETTVRRLTPTECERLQGLPDGYTAGGSDAARYKAIGNGMAQPCADYVIRRIVDEIQGGNDG